MGTKKGRTWEAGEGRGRQRWREPEGTGERERARGRGEAGETAEWAGGCPEREALQSSNGLVRARRGREEVGRDEAAPQRAVAVVPGLVRVPQVKTLLSAKLRHFAPPLPDPQLPSSGIRGTQEGQSCGGSKPSKWTEPLSLAARLGSPTSFHPPPAQED